IIAPQKDRHRWAEAIERHLERRLGNAPLSHSSANTPPAIVSSRCDGAERSTEEKVMTVWGRIPWMILLGLIVVVAQLSDAVGAELKIMCPRSMWTVLNEIGPQFERTSGYRLNVDHDVAATLANRIIDGESFDVFIGPPVQ